MDTRSNADRLPDLKRLRDDLASGNTDWPHAIAAAAVRELDREIETIERELGHG